MILTFPQSYYILTKDHDCLRQLSLGFAKNLLAGRGAIDMKHIERDFSMNAWVQSPEVDLGVGPRPKLN